MDGIVRKDDTIYASINAADEQQIINSEKYLTSGKWLYEVQGQHAISYDGVRAFAAWLARHGLVAQTMSSDIVSTGEGREKKYHAKVRVKEANTGVIFEGLSSQPQYGEKKDGTAYYDSTAETKAHSKAERKAIRKHIPSDLMMQFVEEAKKYGEVKVISQEDGAGGKDRTAGSQDAKKAAGGTAYGGRWCACAKPQPNSRPAVEGRYTGLHVCAECGLPVEGLGKAVREASN